MFKSKKGIIIKIRQSRTFKGLAVLVLFTVFLETVQPTVSMALTEGPSQPEVQSFEPISTTNMVDLFSGDFNYNIPLFNLPGPNGGYPVNLAYHAGVSMDDEASWVGLGWNINAGSLVRDVRGLPDDFKSTLGSGGQASATGDHLLVKQDRMPNRTYGGNLSYEHEVMGKDGNPTGDLLTPSLSVYYNNYRGLGAGVGLTYGTTSPPFKVGLSLDGENGLGVNASFGSGKNNSFSNKLSVNLDGNLSIDYSLSMLKESKKPTDSNSKPNPNSEEKTFVNNFGTGYSFARTGYAPPSGSRADNKSVKVGMSAGAYAAGLFPKGAFSLFYNTEILNKTDQDGRRTPAVGYERNDGAISKDFIRDFSRTNDGQLTRSSIFLANSHYTFDTYNSTGQGMVGYFRAKRNDVGRSIDPHIVNKSQGINLMVEVGAGTGVKWGLDPGLNWGMSEEGAWNMDNDLDFDFNDPYASGINENMYYQAHGEQTILHPAEYDHIKGMSLATAYFSSKSNDGLHNGKRKIENENSSNAWYNKERKHDAIADRVVRNTLIHTLRNFEVSKLGEFGIRYYSKTASLYEEPNLSLSRTTRPFSIDGVTSNIDISNHNAGFKVLNQEGSYYVYGLPAYNNKEVSNVFSTSPITSTQTQKAIEQVGSEVKYKIDNTHEYINKTTKTPYAHSYLLSAVLGADYIDLLNDGPSDDDMGYWVNFNYVKNADDYSWRAPYQKDMAQTIRGAAFTSEDDKLSYQYGEKEIWYLGRIETKSHVAVFITDKPSDPVQRKDGKESEGELPGHTSNGDKSRMLKEIRVYDKKAYKTGANAVPLQVVHLEYGYTLCNNVLNNEYYNDHSSTPKGKLTLKKVWFTSNGSDRGAQSSYEFEYAGSNGNPGINPDYNYGAYDSWGNYKPVGTDKEHNERFPYVNQFNQGLFPDQNGYYPYIKADMTSRRITQTNQDNFSSAWCLTKIKLPSGGEINVKYESDDYGYVQHKTANQMFKIVKLGDDTQNNELYKSTNEKFYDETNLNDEKKRRVYFKLEYPIKVGAANISETIHNNYVKPIMVDEAGNRNLYFKSRMRLTRTPDVYDYISGYLPLEPFTSTNYGVSTDVENVDGVSCYTTGFVTIKAAKKKNGTAYFDKYHPMALAAWTYLQTNAQQLLNNPNSFNSLGDPNAGQLAGKIVDFLNVAPKLSQSFGSIRSYCKDKDMARFIDLNKSCIRLASPDKIKYGGGHRVKEISITDNWASDAGATESNRTYGQKFEYTIKEDDKIISSGVATYEPQAGGDENALKYPINYFDKQTVFTANQLFIEAPLNEELFPGPNVGYRKVTVKSLNTDVQMKRNSDGDAQTVPIGRTGGVAVHEFYTAKEFPTIVKWSDLKEENNTKEIFLLPIIVPFIGSLKRDYFYGSQSFLIELNDMHGKPKSSSTYELNNYNQGVNPITSSEYEYQTKSIEYQQENVLQLDNNVNIIPNDGKHGILSNANGDKHTRMMGVEAELFTDQREFKSSHHDFELDFNVEIPFLPLVTVWPTINDSKSMFRTYVTNKLIHRSGILKRSKIRDLQSVNESEIIAYDEKSGIPLLTKVKNEFGDDFYNYNIPAYYAYDKMGHAYRNINYTFTTSLQSGAPNNAAVTPYLEMDATGHYDKLVRGDELLITAAPQAADKYKKVYFLGWKYTDNGTKAMFHSPQGSITTGTGFELKVIRSGRRNQFGTAVASYLTKGKFEELIRTTPSNPNTVNNVVVDAADNVIKTPLISGNVISATASVFREDWGPSVQMSLDQDLVTENPFLTGNSGIWRPSKSYTYVGARSSNASMDNNTTATTNPKLFNDGVMSSVKMFTWDLGNIEDYVSNWEWVNEVTRYSPDAYELENVNRIGIRSSALYGYDNSLSIGVAGNAGYNEVGAADFETIKGFGFIGDFMKVMSQTNLNFDNDHPASAAGRITEHFKIKKATEAYGEILIRQVENPDIPASYFSGNVNPGVFIGLSLTSRKTATFLGNIGLYFNAVYSIKGTSPDGTLVIIPFLRRGSTEKIVNAGGIFHGQISFFVPRANIAVVPQMISYADNKAHTGKRSMFLARGVTFDQPKLKLKEATKYIFSFWTSGQNENVATYEPNSVANDELVQVGKMSGGSFAALSTAPIIKYGKVIEGWQKVDVEFTWDDPNDIPAIQFIPASGPMYVDDVRLSPKTGGIATYVYDSKKFWLSATLNADNFATLYYYNENGNLHLKKQETEKGIFTVTESRGHVSK